MAVRAEQLLADRDAYSYDDGDEVRAWFSVPVGRPLSGARAIAVRRGLVAFGYQLHDDGIDGDIAYSYVGAVRLGHSVPALSAPPGYQSTIGPNGEVNTPERQWNIEDHIGAVALTRSGWVAWISCRSDADRRSLSSRMRRCRWGISERVLAVHRAC